MYQGPWTNDAMYKAHLRNLKKYGCIELRHNLQHPARMGEFERIQSLMELAANENYNNLILFSTPMDGYFWNMKAALLQNFTTPQELINMYAEYAITGAVTSNSNNIEEIEGEAFRTFCKNDNGFYMPENLMDEREFKNAFQHAATFLQRIYDASSRYWDRLSKKDQSRMAQLVVQGFIAIGALSIAPQLEGEIEEPFFSTFAQICKEDIDRGAVLNATTILFQRLLSEKPLDQNTAKMLAGMLLGRAEMTSHRAVIMHRLKPLLDLLRFVGNNTHILRAALQEYQTSLLD